MYINVIGQGPALVMLHGWSMHSAVWHDLAESLAKHFTLYLVDLPGHGKSDWQTGALELDALIVELAEILPAKAHILGWSLGGLISIAFADRYPQRVDKLILLAATPCFVKTANWPNAMEATVFEAFADNLSLDQTATLQRFLLLQARGSKHSRQTINELSTQLAIETPPVDEALKAGLDLLINTDMRVEFSKLNCPLKLILAERDTLIPAAMMVEAITLNSRLKTTLIAGAGHAPFIAEADRCFDEIEQFLNE
ncbi:MAG: pimeloyl-[acyl-carrier protein] methyl ester esterase [Gammaproteobacteria bacterium]|nr:MAG: pimeloyl-[acyl-carrier protein] methyl ester esterase [Gammaproteobacteria bacterium]